MLTHRIHHHAAVLALLVTLYACSPAAPDTQSVDWRTSPLDLDLRGMNGTRYRFRCPPGKPDPHLVTGSGPYTDASSICNAAVHAGAINALHGGLVDIQILPGQARYPGSTQNFVRSTDYPHPWDGSFVVLARSPPSGSP
jgi:hypothetical protein